MRSAIRKRKRTKKNAVDQAEDGGIGADPEPERDDRDGGKAFMLQEHSNAVTHVLKQTLQIIAGPELSDFFLQLLNATQFNRGQTSRLRCRCAVTDFGFDKKLESLRQFGRKVLLDHCPPKQVSAKSQNPTDESWH